MTDRPDWDEVWMTMADTIGERSRCVRAQIGCVLVSVDNQVVAASYVGPAPGFKPANENPDTDCRSWCARSQPGASHDSTYENCVSCHAEQNAIARADWSRLQGGTAYVNSACCINCAKLLAASGIGTVVMRINPTDAHRAPTKTVIFLQDCGIVVHTIESTVDSEKTE